MSAAEQILDAAFDLACSRGWDKVTMADLASAAGVSRQSVYNDFGNRDGVALALVQREVDRFLVVVDQRLAGSDSAVEAVVEASTAVFDLAEDNPLLRAVLASDDSALLPLFASEVVIAVACERVHAGLPELDGVAVDAIVRVVISHVMAPGRRRPEMAELARRLVNQPAPCGAAEVLGQ
jgi:AcrR family transcriptional regulator